MSNTMSTLVAFLSLAPDYTSSLYGYAKDQEISPAQATADAMNAAAAGDVEAVLVERGGKTVLTACLSKRAVRRIARSARATQATDVRDAIVTALETARPLKIGALVKATGFTRSEVLDALRDGRDATEPLFYSYNPTGSNFHMTWSNEPAGENGFTVFPEPVVVEVAPKVKAPRKARAPKAAPVVEVLESATEIPVQTAGESTEMPSLEAQLEAQLPDITVEDTAVGASA